MIIGWLVLALVVIERLGELVYAGRNTRALLARGGVEYGRGHYKLIVGLHAAWLASLVLALAYFGSALRIHWLCLIAFIFLQPMRLWVLASLGPYWTTRVIRVPGAPIIRQGPFSFIRHPNYTLVAAEIALLPLAFGLWRIALIFSAANAALLLWRLRVENEALAITSRQF